MSVVEIDYANYNRRLRSKREEVTKILSNNGKNPIKPEEKEILPATKKMINWFVSQSIQHIEYPMKHNEYLLFNLQILALPDQFIPPNKITKIILHTISEIQKSLQLNHVLFLMKPLTFFDLLFIFKKFFTTDRLLYIFLNLAKEEYTKFIVKLKRKLIYLIYRIALYGFPKDFLDYLHLFVIYFIKIGILKEKEELLDIIRFIPNYSIAEYKTEPQNFISKYFNRKNIDNSLISAEEQANLIKLNGNKENNEYTGEKNSLYNELMKTFRHKKPEKTAMYIEQFYELLIKVLVNPEKRFKYFANNRDFIAEIKSRIFTNIKTFVSDFNLIKKYSDLINLWDILRIISPYLEKFELKLLNDTLNLAYEKIKPDLYRFNIDKIKEYFSFSLSGNIIISQSNLPELLKRDFSEFLQNKGEPESMLINIEEFCSEIGVLMKLCKEEKIERISEEDFVMNLNALLYMAKIEGKNKKEGISFWFNNIMERKNYGIDLWKKQRNVINYMIVLKFISEEDFKKYDEIMAKKLTEISNSTKKKIIEISKTDLLANGMSEEILNINSPLSEINKFKEENNSTILKSFRTIARVAKNKYDELRPSEKNYKILNQAIDRYFSYILVKIRLNDALRKNNDFENLDFRFKVYGSAANSFWTKNSDIDLTLIIEDAFTAPPV